MELKERLDLKVKLDFILKETKCKNLNQLRVKVDIDYHNLYRVFVKNNGNLNSSSMRKIISLSDGRLNINDLYDVNR
tara:strand:- start:4638 stop:4868 length:231 start_codon:yes stop_codon:yes gene_type:complete